MKEIVIKYELTGVCEIDVKQVLKQWNEKYYISQWEKKYTLCKHSKTASNFSKTSLKVQISEPDALFIIRELGLVNYQSPILRSGSTWKLFNK